MNTERANRACKIEGSTSNEPSMYKAILPALLLFLFTAGCGVGSGEGAQETHEHGGGTAVTVWSDSTEFFFEYPPMIAGGPGEPWAIHVTRLADYSPITEGVLTLAFRGPGGQVFTTTSPAPARPGIYTPAPALPDPGTYEVVMDIDSPRLTDRIPAGDIQVYAMEEDIPHDEEANGGITFLKEQQWPIDFGVARVEEQEIPYTVEVSGELVPAAGRVAEVAAPVSGLALAGPNLSAPAAGERVAAGQSMAVLSPTAQDNSYAEARANVDRLRRDVERLQRLYDAEAVPEKRLVEARHDLEVAESALDAMGGGGSGGDGYRFVVRAPISGIVQQRHFTPGQRVEAGESLFEIINPSVVWLRLNVPARHAAIADAASNAVFQPEGSDIRFRADRVVSVAGAIDPENRTLPVVLAVDNPGNRLKIGQFVQAQLAVGGTRTGVGVPSEAIMQEDGQAVVYVQTGGESFERRPVVLGSTDGTTTLITSGLVPGEYVVTEGAYQVYLASLGTTEIGDHGHPH